MIVDQIQNEREGTNVVVLAPQLATATRARTVRASGWSDG